jgi:hypothetical protein
MRFGLHERDPERGDDMIYRNSFSIEEWQALQFAVIDVFMMVSQIEGEAGMDEAERDAFYDVLHEPKAIESALLQELLISLRTDFKQIFDVYLAQYRFSPDYFERSFPSVGWLIDSKLSKGEAQAFKVALALHFGGIIANASGPETGELGRVSNSELKAMTAIAKWLGTDMRTMPPSRQDEVGMLTETLRRGVSADRLEAVDRLMEILGAAKQQMDLDLLARPTVPALIEALGDGDADVRYEVAMALGLLGESAFSAIPALTRVFKNDEDMDTRAIAVSALGMIAKDAGGLGPYTEQLVPLLTNALQDRDEGIRGFAAGVLGNLVLQEPSAVIKALERVADNAHEDKGVRLMAYNAIERLRA